MSKAEKKEAKARTAFVYSDRFASFDYGVEPPDEAGAASPYS